MPKVKETKVTSSSGGSKGVKLADFSKIPPDALWAIAERFGAGTVKYDNVEVDGTGPAGSNWEKGIPFSSIKSAMQRHIEAAWGGEDIDESMIDELSEVMDISIEDLNGAELHWAAVAWHAIVMLHFNLNYDHYKEFDDRSKISAFIK